MAMAISGGTSATDERYAISRSIPRGSTPVPPGVSVPMRTRSKALLVPTARMSLRTMRGFPELQISSAHSVSATRRSTSFSGMGIGPPVA